mmetsp:Transcript_46592/g.146073  ORF Transcript_46592/g.146073 Transcript_46592/m.146073 type:complete len:531 (-) Transcript_46592:1172-2764(-)
MAGDLHLLRGMDARCRGDLVLLPLVPDAPMVRRDVGGADERDDVGASGRGDPAPEGSEPLLSLGPRGGSDNRTGFRPAKDALLELARVQADRELLEPLRLHRQQLPRRLTSCLSFFRHELARCRCSCRQGDDRACRSVSSPHKRLHHPVNIHPAHLGDLLREEVAMLQRLFLLLQLLQLLVYLVQRLRERPSELLPAPLLHLPVQCHHGLRRRLRACLHRDQVPLLPLVGPSKPRAEVPPRVLLDELRNGGDILLLFIAVVLLVTLVADDLNLLPCHDRTSRDGDPMQRSHVGIAHDRLADFPLLPTPRVEAARGDGAPRARPVVDVALDPNLLAGRNISILSYRHLLCSHLPHLMFLLLACHSPVPCPVVPDATMSWRLVRRAEHLNCEVNLWLHFTGIAIEDPTRRPDSDAHNPLCTPVLPTVGRTVHTVSVVLGGRRSRCRRREDVADVVRPRAERSHSLPRHIQRSRSLQLPSTCRPSALNVRHHAGERMVVAAHSRRVRGRMQHPLRPRALRLPPVASLHALPHL